MGSRISTFPLLLILTILTTLPPQGDCQASVALLVGGWSSPNSSEVLSLEQELTCSLPPLPAEMSGHTVDVVDGKVVACLEYLCYQLVGDSWVFLSANLFARAGHTSSVTDQGLLLVGGWSNPFNLAAYNAEVSASTIVMTGGLDTEDLVTEVSGIGGAVSFKNLSSLTTGRWDHACGMYTVGEATMLIVTGGGRGHPLDSTEVVQYPSDQSWRPAAQLPSPRWGLRSVSLGGTLLVTGGGDASSETDEVLAWDPVAEEWGVAAHLSSPRGNHAVAEVPLELLANFC